MGNGPSSKTTVEVLNDICTQVTMDTIMKCTAVATQEQMIALKAKGDITISDVGMSQGVSINMNCVMQADKQNEIKDKVSAAITQNADSKGQAFLSLFGNTKADAIANIKNKLTNTVTANDELDFKTQLSQQQTISAEAGGNIIMANISMDQSAKIAASALMKTATYSTVINESANKMDQKASSEDKNPIAEMIKAVGSIFSIPVLILGGIVLAVVLVFVMIKFVT